MGNISSLNENELRSIDGGIGVFAIAGLVLGAMVPCLDSLTGQDIYMQRR